MYRPAVFFGMNIHLPAILYSLMLGVQGFDPSSYSYVIPFAYIHTHLHIHMCACVISNSGHMQHIEKKVSKNVNDKNEDMNGDGSGIWQGLAEKSVPFRTGAIALATIPKLVESFKLEANEILKLRPFCHGELDAWLVSDPDGSILHAREVAQRAESRAAAREKWREAEALEEAAAKQDDIDLNRNKQMNDTDEYDHAYKMNIIFVMMVVMVRVRVMVMMMMMMMVLTLMKGSQTAKSGWVNRFPTLLLLWLATCQCGGVLQWGDPKMNGLFHGKP